MGMQIDGSAKLGGPQIRLEDTKAVKCDVCGCEVFDQGVMLREVSSLLTGTGQPGIIPIPVFICSKCGHVNNQFLPQELQKHGESGKLD